MQPATPARTVTSMTTTQTIAIFFSIRLAFFFSSAKKTNYIPKQALVA
jgi:hypothetical protein